MMFAKLRKRFQNNWFGISLLLCLFGFLKEIRPSEPFIYEYLTGKWKNFTDEEVNQIIYPAGTYSYLSQLIIVFLITDLCRYKLLIVLLGVTGIIVWAFLLWTQTILEAIILEIFYGTFSACEVAYFTYIYAKVDKEYYQQVTSHTRAAILAGRATSGIMAQLLILCKLTDYRGLHYITFGAMILASMWSLFLPSVTKSIYFHNATAKVTFNEKTRNAFHLMWNHFVNGYSNVYTIKWCIWWALATCGFIQVQTYMQPLWTAIVNDSKTPIYNGFVEAILTVLGFLGALFAGTLKIDWRTKGELTLTCCSLLQGFIILITSQTENVFVSYACYIVFGGFYHLTITIASTEIAKNIAAEDSYGLIFGFNTFIALLCQTVLTMIVVANNTGFGLPPRQQYFVYGIYHIILGGLYIIIGLTSWLISKRDYRRASTALSSVPANRAAPIYI